MVFSMMVAKALMEADFAGVFAAVPSALTCECPIVVRERGASRTDHLEGGGERGEARVTVLCVRETSNEAEDACYACERAIKARGFTEADTDGEVRVAALDTTWPEPRGRDGSGRWVWAFDVVLTVARCS
mgnify:CR=1 FL=1